MSKITKEWLEATMELEGDGFANAGVPDDYPFLAEVERMQAEPMPDFARKKGRGRRGQKLGDRRQNDGNIPTNTAPSRRQH